MENLTLKTLSQKKKIRTWRSFCFRRGDLENSRFSHNFPPANVWRNGSLFLSSLRFTSYVDAPYTKKKKNTWEFALSPILLDANLVSTWAIFLGPSSSFHEILLSLRESMKSPPYDFCFLIYSYLYNNWK